MYFRNTQGQFLRVYLIHDRPNPHVHIKYTSNIGTPTSGEKFIYGPLPGRPDFGNSIEMRYILQQNGLALDINGEQFFVFEDLVVDGVLPTFHQFGFSNALNQQNRRTKVTEISFTESKFTKNINHEVQYVMYLFNVLVPANGLRKFFNYSPRSTITTGPNINLPEVNANEVITLKENDVIFQVFHDGFGTFGYSPFEIMQVIVSL